MVEKYFVGSIIHTGDNGKLIIINRGGILVENGKIITIDNPANVERMDKNTIELKPSQFLIPGFIDCHIHAVQLPNIGLGFDKSLLDWLETYTFPLEKRFSDLKFADKVFDAVVQRLLSVGTTTACYFASLYGNSSVILAKKASKYCQRAFVGKVNMNFERKDGYYENKHESLLNTTQFIKDVNDIGDPLVKPIITPRFALSCSMDLLKDLAKLAKDFNLPVQTHVSENVSEINRCKELHPSCSTYTQVYDVAGLLTRKTILAHGVYLEDEELEILKERQTAVIHCPSSNTCLKSGMCDVQRLRSNGITVGLGTDVAGGQSVSILDAMRSALQVSQHLAFNKEGYKPLNYADVFHLATLGGAKALAINDKVGNFQIGKDFDALIIDLDAPMSLLDNLKEFTLDEKLQRFIFSGDDRNIVGIYVAGRKIK